MCVCGEEGVGDGDGWVELGRGRRRLTSKTGVEYVESEAAVAAAAATVGAER